MSARHLHHLLASLWTTLTIILCGSCSRPSDGQPGAPLGVVLVVIDTLRADRVSVYGSPTAHTPFLDELAIESVVFENAWSSSSWTPPATASLFTSTFPFQHQVNQGLVDFRARVGHDDTLVLHAIPSDLVTVAEHLTEASYTALGIADNLNIGAQMGFDRGFDRFQTFPYSGADRVNETLALWLEDLSHAPAPMFLYLHYMDPHQPYHPQRPWVTMPKSPGHLRRNLRLAAYDSEVSFVDAALRESLTPLLESGRFVVIITADHGEEFLDHGHFGHGFSLYSELTHVPLIIHIPGLTTAARRIRGHVSLVDVLPTLCGIAGLTPPDQCEGVNLLPLTRQAYLGGKDPGRGIVKRSILADRMLLNRDYPQRKLSIISGDYKYILTQPNNKEELYNLLIDPSEKDDLSSSEPEIRVSLRRRLLHQLREKAKYTTTEADSIDLTEEELDRLRELGYF